MHPLVRTISCELLNGRNHTVRNRRWKKGRATSYKVNQQQEDQELSFLLILVVSNNSEGKTDTISSLFLLVFFLSITEVITPRSRNNFGEKEGEYETIRV